MSNKHILASLLVLSVIAFSCVRKQPVDRPAVAPVAGKGGMVKLVIEPTFSGTHVDSCMIYLKYNTTSRPADSVQYDDSMWVQNNNGKATFDSLKRGDYFIAARGYDPVSTETVIGGASFTAPKPDSPAITYNMTLAVFRISKYNGK